MNVLIYEYTFFIDQLPTVATETKNRKKVTIWSPAEEKGYFSELWFKYAVRQTIETPTNVKTKW